MGGPSLHPEPRRLGARCHEPTQYRTFCTDTERRLSADLERWQYKRGLVLRFNGGNWWGLGHALPAVFDLHHVCRKLQRFCYIRVYEMNLGLMFGYANGMSWHPDPSELEKYPNTAGIRDFPAKERFLARAKALDNVSLLVVDSYRPITLPRPFAYSDLPLPPNSTAAAAAKMRGMRDTRPSSGFRHWPPPWATRCYCRFVTYERFGCSQHVPPVAYHLRTGFADVGAEELALFGKRNTSAVVWWLNLSCPTLLSRPRVHVMSDSPAIVAYHQAARAADDASKEQPFPRDIVLGNSSRAPTRSWMNSFSMQMDAARDVCDGGQAEVLHASRMSSFQMPMVARSMCLKQVNPVDDLHLLMQHKWVPEAELITKKDETSGAAALGGATRCPHWSQVFPRNMYTDSFHKDGYLTLQRNLPPWHPCAGVPVHACRTRFIAATAR